MIRGTFAKIRLRNQLLPGAEGGFSRRLPGGQQGSIYDDAMDYARDGVPLTRSVYSITGLEGTDEAPSRVTVLAEGTDGILQYVLRQLTAG
jgi:hypothetical protein